MIITYQFWGTCFTLQFQLKGHVICRNTKSHRKLNFLMRLLTLTQSISHVSLRKVQLVWQDKQNSQHMEILLLFTFIYVYLSYHISIFLQSFCYYGAKSEKKNHPKLKSAFSKNKSLDTSFKIASILMKFL